MTGRTHRQETMEYLQSVVVRAARAAMEAMAEVIQQEEFTRRDAELLLYELLPDARWAAQEAAYATMRQWEADPTAYAEAFAIVAATLLATERAARQ
jgi:hypothetical protein